MTTTNNPRKPSAAKKRTLSTSKLVVRTHVRAGDPLGNLVPWQGPLTST